MNHPQPLMDDADGRSSVILPPLASLTSKLKLLPSSITATEVAELKQSLSLFMNDSAEHALYHAKSCLRLTSDWWWGRDRDKSRLQFIEQQRQSNVSAVSVDEDVNVMLACVSAMHAVLPIIGASDNHHSERATLSGQSVVIDNEHFNALSENERQMVARMREQIKATRMLSEERRQQEEETRSSATTRDAISTERGGDGSRRDSADDDSSPLRYLDIDVASSELTLTESCRPFAAVFTNHDRSGGYGLEKGDDHHIQSTQHNELHSQRVSSSIAVNHSSFDRPLAPGYYNAHTNIFIPSSLHAPVVSATAPSNAPPLSMSSSNSAKLAMLSLSGLALPRSAYTMTTAQSPFIVNPEFLTPRGSPLTASIESSSSTNSFVSASSLNVPSVSPHSVPSPLLSPSPSPSPDALLAASSAVAVSASLAEISVRDFAITPTLTSTNSNSADTQSMTVLEPVVLAAAATDIPCAPPMAPVDDSVPVAPPIGVTDAPDAPPFAPPLSASPSSSAAPMPSPPSLAITCDSKRASLKKIHWSKLRFENVGNSVWSAILSGANDCNEPLLDLDYDVIAAKFSSARKVSEKKDEKEEQQSQPIATAASMKDTQASTSASPSGVPARRSSSFTAAPRSKPAEFDAIDPVRARNVEIAFSQLKISGDDVKRALQLSDISIDTQSITQSLQSLLELINDTSLSSLSVCESRTRSVADFLIQPFPPLSLTHDQLDLLSRIVPTSEESTRVSSTAVTDPSNVSIVERFYRLLSDNQSLPRVKRRVDLLCFYYSAISDCVYIQQSLHTVNLARLQLLTSHSLRSFLSLVLRIGNTVNHGSNKGEAFGFKLSSLLDMTSVRLNDGVSMLDWCVRQHCRTQGPSQCLLTELNQIPLAATIDTVAITASLQSLALSIQESKKELVALSSSGSGNESMIALLSSMIDNLTPVHGALSQHHTALLQSDCPQLCTFLAEPDSRIESLLDTLKLILVAYRKAKEDASLPKHSSVSSR